MKRSYLVFLSFILLESCAVNKAAIHPYSYSPTSPTDYWTPSKKLSAIAKTQVVLEATQMPDTSKPLTLAELLNVALLNNPETKQTWAQAREAASQYGQSQSSLMPSLDGSYSYDRIRNSSFLASTSAGDSFNGESSDQLFITLYSQWSPQFSLAYTLFDFGQRRATSLAAKEALYYADYTHNRAIETLLDQITTDYYNYLYAEMLLIAYKANVETAQTTLDAAKLGIDTGVKDISDVLQANTQLLQNEITFISEKQNVQNTFVTLLNDMGVSPNLHFTLVPMPSTIPEKEIFPDTDTLIQIALENRPDYLAARAELRSKKQSLIAAKRELLPTFNYNLNFGKTYYQGGLNDRYDYTSAVSVNMPIFSGFYYRNNIKLAEANKTQAEAQLQQVELSVIKDIASYRYNLDIAYETMQYSKAYLEAATKQYDVSLSKYKMGTNTILDVISAQSSLADARAKQASSIQEWYVTLAGLTYAIGIASKTPINEENSNL